MVTSFKEYVARRELAEMEQGGMFNEMAARRSFARSIGKFQPQLADKPVAILTAFRGDASLVDNQTANAKLVDDLKKMNLSFYPVKGAGQEERKWLFGLFRWIEPTYEDSFVVQPRGDMLDKDFEAVIRGLVQKYGQYGAAVKLPSEAHAFIVRPQGRGSNLGSNVGPTTTTDDYYTQLRGGARADQTMLRPWEVQGEQNHVRRFINWLAGRSFMNYPADQTKIGRRFSIRPDQPEGGTR